MSAIFTQSSTNDTFENMLPSTSKGKTLKRKTIGNQSQKMCDSGDDDDNDDDNDDDDDDDDVGAKEAEKIISSDVILEIEKISVTVREFIHLDDSLDTRTEQKLHELRDLISKSSRNLRKSYERDNLFERKIKRIIKESLKSSLIDTNEKFLGNPKLSRLNASEI